jgi:hypothetical protein
MKSEKKKICEYFLYVLMKNPRFKDIQANKLNYKVITHHRSLSEAARLPKR